MSLISERGQVSGEYVPSVRMVSLQTYHPAALTAAILPRVLTGSVGCVTIVLLESIVFMVERSEGNSDAA